MEGHVEQDDRTRSQGERGDPLVASKPRGVLDAEDAHQHGPRNAKGARGAEHALPGADRLAANVADEAEHELQRARAPEEVDQRPAGQHRRGAGQNQHGAHGGLEPVAEWTARCGGTDQRPRS